MTRLRLCVVCRAVIVDGRVVNFRSDPNAPALELLQLAAAVEVKSEHPLAQANRSDAPSATATTVVPNRFTKSVPRWTS